jgi:hypothetical protein
VRRDDPPRNFISMLMLGLPGLMLVNPAAAVKRLISVFYLSIRLAV